jgi:hypothetical protein
MLTRRYSMKKCILVVIGLLVSATLFGQTFEWEPTLTSVCQNSSRTFSGTNNSRISISYNNHVIRTITSPNQVFTFSQVGIYSIRYESIGSCPPDCPYGCTPVFFEEYGDGCTTTPVYSLESVYVYPRTLRTPVIASGYSNVICPGDKTRLSFDYPAGDPARALWVEVFDLANPTVAVAPAFRIDGYVDLAPTQTTTYRFGFRYEGEGISGGTDCLTSFPTVTISLKVGLGQPTLSNQEPSQATTGAFTQRVTLQGYNNTFTYVWKKHTPNRYADPVGTALTTPPVHLGGGVFEFGGVSLNKSGSYTVH